MFERIFGKRKSLQRNLVIDLIICIIIVMFISLVGFYIFVNYLNFPEAGIYTCSSEKR